MNNRQWQEVYGRGDVQAAIEHERNPFETQNVAWLVWVSAQTVLRRGIQIMIIMGHQFVLMQFNASQFSSCLPSVDCRHTGSQRIPAPTTAAPTNEQTTVHCRVARLRCQSAIKCQEPAMNLLLQLVATKQSRNASESDKIKLTREK